MKIELDVCLTDVVLLNSVFFGKNLFSWTAKKKDTVARYSIEAEYRSFPHTTA